MSAILPSGFVKVKDVLLLLKILSIINVELAVVRFVLPFIFVILQLL